ncbi:alpha-(1,3)-fucosyltransferase C-like [Anticarsia gemmatalis]|uniref:alpha-(1,3)-fucosyltransferase C-like n=1 Tax=Anticarsia gemmatalis TaxID=129554 RepID=UPI003F76DB03
MSVPTTIMSKVVKTFLFAAYAYLFLQYLKNTLTANIEDVELYYVKQSPAYADKVMNFKSQKLNKTWFKKEFRKPLRFVSDFKYILKYTESFLHSDSYVYENGQTAFIRNKCKYINCYFTNDRNMLADVRNFDAIMFDVENDWDSVLLLREPYQKFIFMASESSANNPLCDRRYNDYYNLTWTYKLDSDIRWTYLAIYDKRGNVVGPKINMTWVDPMKSTPLDVKEKLRDKRIAAAWFVSNCKTKSGRANVTDLIEIELRKYGLFIDTFGWCGKRTCPKDRFEDCLALLESDYYFYLSFENSFSEDYVTEKILYPLQHYTVPIVLGGANYSRFLPPGSYIDARKLNASQVAAEMYKAIKDPAEYEKYFQWHNYYEYEASSKNPDVCQLCKILNEEADKRSSYKNLLEWWNPDYVKCCSHGEGRILLENKKNSKELEPFKMTKDIMDVFL